MRIVTALDNNSGAPLKILSMGTSKQASSSARAPSGAKNGVSKRRSSASEEFSILKGNAFFVTKGSSDMKWQRAKMVVGALAVKSYPFLQPKEDMEPLYKDDGGETKSKFEDALQVWEDLTLRKSFTKACADLPASSSCCGFSQSNDASSIKQYSDLLNDGWVKYANNKLKSRGFKIDTFLWNVSASKPEDNTLLIRFFELSTYKFRRASHAGSLDLDDMLLEQEAKDDSS